MELGKISIVVPVYNACHFLEDTIKTIIAQTYTNFEVILVDDKSTDSSKEILMELKTKSKDDRIKIYSLKEKGYAAGARNFGINKSTGEYICFLDADDLWDNTKLEKQIKFMKQGNYAFSFTGYEFANKEGKPLGKKVYIPNEMKYNDLLKNTTISTITVMFDMKKLSKKMIQMPKVKSEDTACWLQILKKGYTAYGLNEILSYYRRSENTLSSNKVEALKRIWYLYRNVENLSFVYSCYCICNYLIHAILRRV